MCFRVRLYLRITVGVLVAQLSSMAEEPGDWGSVTASEDSLLFEGAIHLNTDRYKELLQAAQDSLSEARTEQSKISQYQLLSAQDDRQKVQLEKDELKPAQDALNEASDALSAASPQQRPAAEARVKQAANQLNDVEQKLVRIDQAMANRSVESARDDWTRARSRLDSAHEEARPAFRIEVERGARVLKAAEAKAAETKAKDYRALPARPLEDADRTLKQVQEYLQKAVGRVKNAEQQAAEAGKRPSATGDIQFRALASSAHNSVLLDKTPDRARENFIMLNGERLQITEKQLGFLGIASDDYIPVQKDGKDWGRLSMGRHKTLSDGTIEVQGQLDDGLIGKSAQYFVTWTAKAKK